MKIEGRMGELIRDRSGYKNLLCYKKSDLIFMITDYFTQTHIDSRSRTVDQMVQAARSGKQNIIEGIAAGATSKKTQIKLVNVAKASLRELLEDYEDYLKTHNAEKWEKGDQKYEAMRQLGIKLNSWQEFQPIITTRPAATIANMAIILLEQADYLLYKFLTHLESEFLQEGGFTEKMFSLRKKNKGI